MDIVLDKIFKYGYDHLMDHILTIAESKPKVKELTRKYIDATEPLERVKIIHLIEKQLSKIIQGIWG